MKKLPIILAVLLSVCCLSSCLEDKGNTAEATCQYYGTCEGITYKDSADTIMQPLILESLKNLELIGEKSLFKESANVDNSSILAAYAICDEQAIKTYTKKVEAFDREALKNDIFVHHSDSLAAAGYPTAQALPLDSLTIDIYLYNASGLNPLVKYNVKR